MELEYALKYVIDHKNGFISELDDKVGKGTGTSLVVTGMIKVSSVGLGMKW